MKVSMSMCECESHELLYSVEYRDFLRGLWDEKAFSYRGNFPPDLGSGFCPEVVH